MAAPLIRRAWSYRQGFILGLTPLLLLPLPLVVRTTEATCGYVILLMAVYWITEVIPMAVTSLIPAVLLPTTGLLTSRQVALNYIKDSTILFMGGLMVALAIERWNIHKRLALRVLMLVGSQPKWLMLGFMLVTSFLSMWITNTATTAMMAPIALAVVDQLRHRRKVLARTALMHGEIGQLELMKNSNSTLHSREHVELYPNDDDPDVHVSREYADKDTSTKETNQNKDFVSVSTGMVLCIAYAANIGGISTLTGTLPNLIVKSYVDTTYGAKAGVTFSSWFIFAFPCMLLSLLLAWFYLQLAFLGRKSLCQWRCKDDDTGVAEIIKQEYKQLGPVSFAEAATLGHFVLLAVLWITRDPGFIPGWGSLFPEGFVTDACPSILVSTMMFMCPSQRPKREWFTGRIREVPCLLDWRTATTKLPWGVLILIGGGMAVAHAAKESGLSVWVGQQFVGLTAVPAWATVLIVSTIVAAITEVTSNTATMTIFLPILGQIAGITQVNPLYLMLPAAIAASFAFMLPVATPPNALVFSYGMFSVGDMAKAGFVLNITCILALNFIANTWGRIYFNFHSMPSWARDMSLVSYNSTVPPETVTYI